MIWVCNPCFLVPYIKGFKADAASLAIWDNRSAYHAATFDYSGLGPRTGHRVVGLGEKPYFDPKSTSRREALERLEEEGRI